VGREPAEGLTARVDEELDAVFAQKADELFDRMLAVADRQGRQSGTLRCFWHAPTIMHVFWVPTISEIAIIPAFEDQARHA